MSELQAAADRVRRHKLNEDVLDRTDLIDDLKVIADAYLTLHHVATAMLGVLVELQPYGQYWDNHYRPRGIADRINTAVADGRNALNITE